MESTSAKKVLVVAKPKKTGEETLTKTERDFIKKLMKQEILAVQEKKSFDSGFGSTVDNVGTVTKLTTIPQGDTDSSRQGDHIKLHEVQLWAQVNYADTTNAVRLLIIRWNQDDSSAAPSGVTNFFQTATPFSPYDRDNQRARKFDVIFDHLFVVSNVGPGTEKYVIRKGMKSQIAFQGGANTGTGHLYSVLVSDSSASTHPGVNYVFRTYYTDS